MRGYWLTNTFKCNRHYQSGGAVPPSGSYAGLELGVGNHYIGFAISGKKYKFNRLVCACVAAGAVNFVYQPYTVYNSFALHLNYRGTPCTTNPSILCPANGTVYTLHDNLGTAIETLTVDFTSPLAITITGFSKIYDYIGFNVAVYFASPSTYTLTIGG